MWANFGKVAVTLTILVSASAIPFENFVGYPFGEEYGDQIFYDHYYAVRFLNVSDNPFHFFGQRYSFISVSI